MVRERIYGDVWSRVARVDRWVDLLRFRDVMSLIGCVGARVRAWVCVRQGGQAVGQAVGGGGLQKRRGGEAPRVGPPSHPACTECLSLAPWTRHGVQEWHAQEWHAHSTRQAHTARQGRSHGVGGARNPAWALLHPRSLLNN